ncbi:hypothetical protein ACFZ8E_14435 [Methylobacterium sp. HMF5984]|uniref:hypothetical protein n=1 Tax=Methylobacterium sp. HMF5984 TaxID=3367370 RepID=UPI0038539473
MHSALSGAEYKNMHDINRRDMVGNIKLTNSKPNILMFAKIQIFSIIFLQKLAIPIGADGEIQLVLPIFLLSLLFIKAKDSFKIDIMNSMSYILFIIIATISQIIAFKISINSFGLLIALYILFLLKFEINRNNYAEIQGFFVNCMAIISCITIYQAITQYTVGIEYWPNLDKILPNQILFSNYNYMQRLSYLSIYFKPNGIFLLEASFISQFCVIALIIEILTFRRIIVSSLLSISIVLSLSGTGLMILGFCAPVLIGRASGRMIVAAIVVIITTAIAGSFIGWFDTITNRMTEFSSQGTSGYARFAVPINLFIEQISDPAFLITGNGAGQTVKGAGDYILLPFAKLVSEYGTAAFLSFYAFIIIAIFHKTANFELGFMLFIFYNISGSTLVLPSCVLLIPILSTMYSVKLEVQTKD